VTSLEHKPRKAIEMRLTIHTIILMAIVAPTLCCSHEKDGADPTAVESSTFAKAFRNCDFQFTDTTQVNRVKKPDGGLSLHRDGACSYYLNISSFSTLGDQDVVLMIVNQYGNLINQSIAQSGFEKKSDGTWSFIGNSFSIGKLIKYQKLTFNEVNNGQDITLAGRQIEHGTDQTGTPITFEGVHVLRLSPTYAISIDMPFDASTPIATRDEVVKDLIELVDSVRSTTSASPATVQSTH
jgi:hypothetical protein